MDRESAFRFAPAFPLDEASAHGIIFFFQQGFAPAVVQGQNQGVAVGAVVLDAVVNADGFVEITFTEEVFAQITEDSITTLAILA